MEPKIRKSPLTGEWYVITRWHTKAMKNGQVVLIADRKYDVTEQMKEILKQETKRP